MEQEQKLREAWRNSENALDLSDFANQVTHGKKPEQVREGIDKIADWWLSKRRSEIQEEIKHLEGRKVKEVPVEEIERLRNANHFEQKIEMYKMGHNKAITDLINYYKEKLENIK